MCRECEDRRNHRNHRCGDRNHRKKKGECCKCVPIKQRQLRCGKTLVLDKEGTKYVFTEFLEFDTQLEHQTAISVKADNITIDFCNHRLTQVGNVNHAVGITLVHGFNNFHVIGANIKNFTGKGILIEGNNDNVLIDQDFNIDMREGDLNQTPFQQHAGIVLGNPRNNNLTYPHFGPVKAVVKDGCIKSFDFGILTTTGDIDVDNVNIDVKTSTVLRIQGVREEGYGVSTVDISGFQQNTDLSVIAGSKVVTVNKINHNLNVGDVFIIMTSTIDAAVVNLNSWALAQQYSVSSVIDVNTFTFETFDIALQNGVPILFGFGIIPIENNGTITVKNSNIRVTLIGNGQSNFYGGINIEMIRMMNVIYDNNVITLDLDKSVIPNSQTGETFGINIFGPICVQCTNNTITDLVSLVNQVSIKCFFPISGIIKNNKINGLSQLETGVSNFGSSGILILNCTNMNIESNRISGINLPEGQDLGALVNASGIFIGGSSNCMVMSNTINDINSLNNSTLSSAIGILIEQGGVDAQRYGNNTIQDNTIKSIGQTSNSSFISGILCLFANSQFEPTLSKNILIQNNIINKINGQGVFLVGGLETVVNNNTIIDCVNGIALGLVIPVGPFPFFLFINETCANIKNNTIDNCSNTAILETHGIFGVGFTPSDSGYTNNKAFNCGLSTSGTGFDVFYPGPVQVNVGAITNLPTSDGVINVHVVKTLARSVARDQSNESNESNESTNQSYISLCEEGKYTKEDLDTGRLTFENSYMNKHLLS